MVLKQETSFEVFTTLHDCTVWRLAFRVSRVLFSTLEHFSFALDGQRKSEGSGVENKDRAKAQPVCNKRDQMRRLPKFRDFNTVACENVRMSE